MATHINKILPALLIGLFFTFLVPLANAEDVLYYDKPELSLFDLIKEKAELYGVSENLLTYIIFKESSWNPLAVGDMDLQCSRTKKPVRARGILQLTECWWGHVSDECAFDPRCALHAALPQIAKKKTCISQWTACRNYYKNFP